LVGRQPSEFVDLVAHAELSTDATRRPIAHLLTALLHGIAHRHEPSTEMCAKARLLLDLADRGHRFRLAGIDFALGKRPIVVSETVDHRDRRRARTLLGPPQYGPRSEN